MQPSAIVGAEAPLFEQGDEALASGMTGMEAFGGGMGGVGGGMGGVGGGMGGGGGMSECAEEEDSDGPFACCAINCVRPQELILLAGDTPMAAVRLACNNQLCTHRVFLLLLRVTLFYMAPQFLHLVAEESFKRYTFPSLAMLGLEKNMAALKS